MCDVVDAGTEWQFVDGQPLPDFEPFCASKCVDFPGTLTIVGQRDLRKVPLLPKLRKVNRLIVNIDGLPDLRGLEKVDIETLLNLVSHRVDSPDLTFVSMAGLEDDSIDVITIDNAPGLPSLSSGLRRAQALSIVSTGIREVDLHSVAIRDLALVKNPELRSVALGSGTMQSVLLEWNKSLDTFSWGDLQVRQSVRISGNPNLSTCRAEEFTRDAGAPRTTVIDNGPCP
ncbi:MAG: hypothetical protein ACOZQL_28055 [Myxococcota bacterium]